MRLHSGRVTPRTFCHRLYAGSVALLVLLSVSQAVAVADDQVAAPVVRLTKTYQTKFFLRFSPDGTHIAYSRHYMNPRKSQQILVGTHLVKSDGTDDRRVLTDYDSQVQIQEHPVWSADSRHLYLSGGGNDTGNSSKDVYVCDVDEAFKVTNLRKVAAGDGVQLGEEPTLSPDGSQIAYTTTTERLYAAGIDGKNPVQVVQVDGVYCHQPDWSPDGRWIAFSTDRDGDVEIYKVRPDGTELTRLTSSKGFDSRPRWSPDGRWILFTSNRTGNYELFLMRGDGTDLRNLTRHPGVDDQADWHPSGKWIAFVSFRSGAFDLYRLDVPPDVEIFDHPPQMLLAGLRASNEDSGPLVAHYDFEDVMPDQRVRDQAGRHHLSLSGAEVVSTGTGRSLKFDGRDDYARAGNGQELRISGALTLSLWLKPDKFDGNSYILSKHGWNIYVGSDARPRFETRSAANDAWLTLVADRPLPTGRWSHVTAVFDPDRQRMAIYVDGRLSAEQERTDGAIGAADAYGLEFGHYNVSQSQNYSGLLDEISIFNVALDDAQISEEFSRQGLRVGAAAN